MAAEAQRAFVVDGEGPWRDDRWAVGITQFTGLLTDAGYAVAAVSPLDLPAALDSPDILLAVPSLEQLPFDTLRAISTHVRSGGTLMASGGEPFHTALYRAPNGDWLDFGTYHARFGTDPPQGPLLPPVIETLSPSWKQYTAGSGLRFPLPRSRGLTSVRDEQGRYRVIGEISSPSATLYSDNLSGSMVIWLPWPQLYEPHRSQLVGAIRGFGDRLHLMNAGPEQIIWLPGERIAGAANVFNVGGSAVQAVLQWSISGASGVVAQPAIPLSLGAREQFHAPLDIGILPSGDYTLQFRLFIGNEEVDRVDSPVRVLDPTLTRHPDQKIRVLNGSFTAAGQHIFLRGVNYWPKYISGLDQYRFSGRSWLAPDQYDPDIVEADLSQIAALNFNLIDIRYGELAEANLPQIGRGLIDFLERCRSHGLWVRIDLPATRTNNAFSGNLNPDLSLYLNAAYLPGNDRVFAYEVLWEPFLGLHDHGGYGAIVNGAAVYNVGRQLLDAEWRAWVNDQYGSLAGAEQIWAFTAPRDSGGQLTNPLDDQIANDGPWRIMVAAYRRFLEDYFGRNLGAVAREIRRVDPDTLLTYRNWTTMTAVHNSQTGYDIGTAAAHLDFFSPENYDGSPGWPDDRKWGFVTAYSRYRTGGKPVQWAEFGADIGPDGGNAASRAAQATVCDSMMRQVNEDGSNAATVWWWPGGLSPVNQTDFGIIDPDGTPRQCALVMSQWAATFASAPPDLVSPPAVPLAVDRDSDARGDYGLFLNWSDRYVQARETGQSIVLKDAGTGTDTATMPLLQVGSVPFTGTGPLKFANSEVAGVHIQCTGVDVTVENGSQVPVPPGAACQFTPAFVNTGEAQWLPSSAATGGLVLHTTINDVPLSQAVPSLQTVSLGPLTFTMSQQSMNLTGRLRIQGLGDFGEILKITLAVDSSGNAQCSTALSVTGPISAPEAGAGGAVDISTGAGCAWSVSSSQPWVTLTPASGTGTGRVSYQVQPNTGPLRQANISIGGHPLTVLQAAKSQPAMVRPPMLSGSSLEFGAQVLGMATVGQSITLTNGDTLPLNLATLAIGGPNSSDFRQTNTCHAVLAAAAACSITVLFSPSAAGRRAASLVLDGNMMGGPLAVSLSGTGIGQNPRPTIAGIADSWGYTAGVAPGLWVTIAGLDLAVGPQTWNLAGTQLPTSLGGVAVTFNGTPAALSYVSPKQINALVPASLGLGPAQVVVEVNGVASAPFSTTVAATHPAAYALPNADATTFSITAALQGSAVLVGDAAIDPRVVRAAYPGDIIDVYMIGLGATADLSKFVTDRVFSGAFPVAAQITATVGGKPAGVVFAGLISPGLYLARLAIPVDMPPGPQLTDITTGEVQTRSSLVLLIAAAPSH